MTASYLLWSKLHLRANSEWTMSVERALQCSARLRGGWYQDLQATVVNISTKQCTNKYLMENNETVDFDGFIFFLKICIHSFTVVPRVLRL